MGLDLKNRTLIMGVINITPDSFSDGGKFNSLEKAAAHAKSLIENGVDILDIGGESTRPFSKPVPLEEELKRVVPVIKELRKITDLPISIDTTKSEVAFEAVKAGAAIINDVSALSMDENMAKTAAKLDVPVVLMHMKGTPETMQENPSYDDLMKELHDYFRERIDYSVKNGIKKENLILDPGIGFGKTLKHNLVIIKKLQDLKSFGLPILLGTSRKTFIRNLTKKDDLPNDPDVITGSVASICAGSILGADIVRVHDVKETKAALAVVDAIKNV